MMLLRSQSISCFNVKRTSIWLKGYQNGTTKSRQNNGC